MSLEFISAEEYKRQNTPPAAYTSHMQEVLNTELTETDLEDIQTALKLIASVTTLPRLDKLDKLTPTNLAYLCTYDVMVKNKNMAIRGDIILRSPQVIMDNLFKRVFKALELITACRPEAVILMKGYMKELEIKVEERKSKNVVVNKQEQALIDFEKSLTKEEYNQSEAAPLLKTTRKSLNAWKDEIEWVFSGTRPKISKSEMIRLYKIKVLKLK